MAYKIIRPRHGIKSLWNTYKSRIYKLGEMLVESPDSGVGSGHVNIKFGDGVTDYENLPYAVEAPISQVIEGSEKPFTSGGAYALKNDLTESLEWKHIGTAQASTAFTSDFTQYKELSLRCALSGYGSMYITIPTISLSSTAMYCAPIDTLVNGKISKLALQITNSSISIYTAYDDGNDAISSSRIYVYAR